MYIAPYKLCMLTKNSRIFFSCSYCYAVRCETRSAKRIRLRFTRIHVMPYFSSKDNYPERAKNRSNPSVTRDHLISNVNNVITFVPLPIGQFTAYRVRSQRDRQQPPNLLRRDFNPGIRFLRLRWF